MMNDAPGRITIAPDVLLTIIRRSVLKQPGVVALVGKPAHLTEEKRHAQKAKAEGIRIVVDDEEGVGIGLRLIARKEKGVSMHTLATQIQEDVARSIETITGLPVRVVDVHIEAIKQPENNAEYDAR